ncbi:MAG: efflux transporter outer membrane subunit [Bacteroidales bacterium]|jgi:NodT family efflux transporter outer membrane factor (OMF) lipoprotein|nr:efflux transporter outer membrane subunit [Bacteroidales bacterium]
MNKHRNFRVGAWLLIFHIGILSSCQIFNRYHSPEYDARSLFRGEDPSDTTTIADIPWKKYFNDTILVGLIDEGLKNNYDLRIAATRIREAEVNLKMARAGFFPSVSIVAEAAETRVSMGESGKKVLGYPKDQFTLAAAVSWELDIWGKISRQKRAAYARFLSSETYKNLVQTSLIANIATTYYALLAMDEQLTITTETIELLEESKSTMEALKDAGVLNGAAVEQSKALLYATRTSVPDLENQVRQLENSICLMLGRKPDSIPRSSMSRQVIPDELKYGVPVQMLAKRPDIRQAELGFRAAFELTNAARASFYPSLTLGSQTSGSMIGYTSTTISDFFKPENIMANIAGGLVQPIFAKRQLTGNLQIAKAQQEEALLTFEKTVLDASQEVSDILYSYKSSLRKNETRAKQVEALKTAVYFTQELLKAGEANYTEVLTAEQNLLQAQLSQVNDFLEQLQATVNLYRALGGGAD